MLTYIAGSRMLFECMNSAGWFPFSRLNTVKLFPLASVRVRRPRLSRKSLSSSFAVPESSAVTTLLCPGIGVALCPPPLALDPLFVAGILAPHPHRRQIRSVGIATKHADRRSPCFVRWAIELPLYAPPPRAHRHAITEWSLNSNCPVLGLESEGMRVRWPYSSFAQRFVVRT